MPRAIPTFGLLLVAALAAAIWWFGTAAAPALATPGDGSEAPLVGAEVAPAPAIDDPAAVTAAVRVWVELQPTAQLEPAGPVAMVVTLHGRLVAATAAIVAGDAGEWPDATAPRGAVLVRLQHEGAAMHRVAERGDDGVVHVDLGADRPLRGHVVDQMAAPVADARVWCGGPIDRDLRTDADGHFACAVAAGPGVPIVVRADGKAWKYRTVTVGDDGASVEFVLVGEQPLPVQASGFETSLRQATAYAVPSSTDAIGTEIQQYPFFAPAVFGDLVFDATGGAVVRGLPAGAVVGLVVCGPAMACTRIDGITLRPTAHVDVQVPARPLARGVVVDEHGAPVVGAEVWCWPAGGAVLAGKRAAMLLPAQLPATGVVVGITATDGAFALALPHADRLVLGARNGRGHASTIALATPPIGPVRLVLPDVVAAASVTVMAPEPGAAWSLRVDPGTDGRFVAQDADARAVVALDRCMVADVRVRVASDGTWSPPRLLREVVLAGAWRLPVELLRH